MGEELKLIQNTYMKTWQIFISWFTWFAGINLLALSLILTKRAEVDEGLFGPFIYLMELFILSGVIATFCVWFYTRRARGDAERLATADQRKSLHGILPAYITEPSCLLIGVCLAALAVVWWKA